MLNLYIKFYPVQCKRLKNVTTISWTYDRADFSLVFGTNQDFESKSLSKQRLGYSLFVSHWKTQPLLERGIFFLLFVKTETSFLQNTIQIGLLNYIE